MVQTKFYKGPKCNREAILNKKGLVKGSKLTLKNIQEKILNEVKLIFSPLGYISLLIRKSVKKSRNSIRFKVKQQSNVAIVHVPMWRGKMKMKSDKKKLYYYIFPLFYRYFGSNENCTKGIQTQTDTFFHLDLY